MAHVPRWRPKLVPASVLLCVVVSSLSYVAGGGRAQAATCTTPTTIAAATVPPWPAGPVLAANGSRTAYQAGTSIAWGPNAVASDTVTRDPAGGVDAQSQAILSWYNAHDDVLRDVNPPTGFMVSTNAGATFSAPTLTDPSGQSYGYLSQIGNLLDGRLLAVRFVANAGGVSYHSTTKVTMFPLRLHISEDKGRTWRPLTASVSFTDAQIPSNLPLHTGANIRGISAAGRPIQMTDGTVVLPIYFSMANGTPNISFASVFTARPPTTASGSTDANAAWTFDMHAITSNPTYSFNETAVVQRQDGVLLAVTRGDLSPSRLSYKTSSNGGVSWSAIADVAFADQPGCAVHGVLPQLALMPNGVLVLSSGRPDNWIAFSPDGSGTSWQREQVTYKNRLSGGTWWYGSSGYTAVVPVGANQLLQFFDNCQAPNGSGVNGCATSGTYTHGNYYAVLNRNISTLTADVGKIDLAGKLKAGTVTLTTDMTGVAPPDAVSAPTPYGVAPSAADATRTNYYSAAEGAVDGSTAYWSSAISSRADGTGTYTLKLDRLYRLTKLGLALRPGVAAGAEVSVSTDGATWTSVVQIANTATNHALRYYPINATAGYVRITTAATAGCAYGASCSMINELELNSTVDSFENEPAVPRGLASLACVRVTQPAGNGDLTHDSRYALRLKDGTDASYCDGSKTIGRLVYPGPGQTVTPAANKVFQVSVDPLTVSTGILFDIYGLRSSDQASAPVYSFGISNQNTLMWYTTAASWVIFPSPAVPSRVWITLKVVASTTSAKLYVTDGAGHDTLVGSLPKRDGTAFASLSGYGIGSGGTLSIGDEAVIDDVSFDTP